MRDHRSEDSGAGGARSPVPPGRGPDVPSPSAATTCASRVDGTSHPPTDGAADWSAHARRWTVVLLVAGAGWRLIRYGLGFPIWGDEAALMLSVIQRHSYAELLRPLDDGQIAPLGFLAAQLTAVHAWGTSPYALRLFPLITGLAALFLFARLAWLALPPLGAMFAVGVLGATHYVTRYSLDIKPYGTDLMAAAALLLLAVQWSRAPDRRRWLVFLIVATPVAFGLSYPAVFVAGAVGLGLLRILLRRRPEPVEWALLALYAVVAVASFGGLSYLWTSGQYEGIRTDMLAYWARGFPPADPLRFVVWLVDVHTAEMMSYPLGGKNGGSAATAILCLMGIGYLLKRRQGDLVLVLGSTFALTFVAAVLRRYPYGGSARVAQHLAPAICLLAGAALQGIVCALDTGERRRRAALITSVTLLVLTLGGVTRDVLHPYHTKAHQDLSRLMGAWTRERLPDSGIWLMGPFESLPLSVRWYVLESVAGDRARLVDRPPEPGILARHREWWVLNCDPGQEADAALPPRAQLAEAGYLLRHTRRLDFSPARPGSPHTILELQRWQRPP